MRLFVLVSTAALVFASASASAQEPSIEAPVAPRNVAPAATDNPDETRIRCRRIPMTGSHVRVERVCKTVAEWRRLSERGNDVVRDQADTGRVCAGGEFCRGN